MKPTRKINYDISNLKLSVLSSVNLVLRFFIFRALFCDSLVLKVISFDRVAVLICSVAIFCEVSACLKNLITNIENDTEVIFVHALNRSTY
jgi:hypothetical protein